MNTGKPIRVLVIDDHKMVRDALRILLENGNEMQLAADAADAFEGVGLAVRTRPDVILLDIGMQGLSGIQAAHRLHKEVPGSKVLIVSQYDDEEYVLEALGEAGAAGYVIKSDGGSELIAAIRAVAAGKRYISPAVAPIVLEKMRRGSTARRASNDGVLTKREREILDLIAEGTPAKAIAGKLGISPKTVQVHRSNIAAKLRLPSTAAIVRYAIKHKLVKPD